MRFFKLFILTIAGFGLAATQIASAADVNVKFSPRIEKNLASLNQVEKKREVHFRQYREEGSSRVNTRNLNYARFAKAEFAAERLIPNVEDFSIRAIAEAMAAHSLVSVENHNPDHKLVVEIEDFFAANYPIAKFSSFSTRMKGRVSLLDAADKVIATKEISTTIIPHWSGNYSYSGPEYAFLEQSMDVRFAPVLAAFLKKGIERLYPDADVPGPIFLMR